MKRHDLIICRSLTYAQRTAKLLERAGIHARMFRSPKLLSGEGCAYAVQIAEQELPRVLVLLKDAGLSPLRVFLESEDGQYQEVLK